VSSFHKYSANLPYLAFRGSIEGYLKSGHAFLFGKYIVFDDNTTGMRRNYEALFFNIDY
jgi:hypothetical protein